MSASLLLLALISLSVAGFFAGRGKAMKLGRKSGSRATVKLHSRPAYHGLLIALCCAVPACVMLGAWQIGEGAVLSHLTARSLPAEVRALPPDRLGLVLNDVKNVAYGNYFGDIKEPYIEDASQYYQHLQSISGYFKGSAVILAGLALSMIVFCKIAPTLKARYYVESIIKAGLILCSSLAVFTTVGIIFSVLFEALRFFQSVPVFDFLFGLDWSPQTAIRKDQVGSSGAFGAVPVFTGTLMISGLAMAVAVPIGLLSAIYLSEYAGRKVRSVVKPLIEILAGIPTVVYGFFAALVVAPFIRDFGTSLNLAVASESALAAGLIMGIMIIPFILSISDDVMNAVPQALRDGAYALGATKSETIRQVIVPAALPGIIGGILLAVSRAIGETMIVVMAAGLTANLTFNPLQAVTTVTVQIVTLLVGDQEFDSPKTLAAFALALLLLLVTLVFNVTALYIVRKYREQYE